MRAKRVLGDFTDRELRVIELRTHGVEPREIATRMGTTLDAIYHVLEHINRKTGTKNLALLTRWAIENALDVPAPPDTPETAAVSVKKERYRRIRMGRIRRAM